MSIPLLRAECREQRPMAEHLALLQTAQPDDTFTLGHLTWVERGEVQARVVVLQLTPAGLDVPGERMGADA